jgi:hypothetical protein
VIRYYLHAGAINYTVTVFSAAVGHRPVNFVRVLLPNRGKWPAVAAWAAGLRYSGGKPEPDGQLPFRFARPAMPERIRQYAQPGASFDPSWVWAFAGRALTRDGQALLVFPRAPTDMDRRLTLRPDGMRLPVSQGTVFVEVEYRGRLGPGASRRLDFAMPVIPTPPHGGDYEAIATARFDVQLARPLRFWRDLYSRAIQLRLPEPKVVDTFYISLANMALPRYPATIGGWVQAVNKLQYNSFWLRDASIMANAFDLAGLHGLAAQDLEFVPSWQQPDGPFMPQKYDGFR